MLSTPLPDYRHAANQTTKARAAAEAAKASRKSFSNSGPHPERKNALQSAAAESRSAAAAKIEPAPRSSSISSNTGSSGLTAVSSNDPTTIDEPSPFVRRNGRRYLRDTTLPYPLPYDLNEINRQTLRTMLLCQVFNGPVCAPIFQTEPPKRVLEVGCGAGFWSVMCHKHFSSRGFPSISFTGLDIAPVAPRMADADMNWRFVQHDLRKVPLPFKDEEFGLIMIKDMSLVTPSVGGQQQILMDEYLRILKPGGTLEIWDGDHSVRMLLPHAPPSTKDAHEEDEDEEQVRTNIMGTYTLTTQTPLAAPQNQFLIDYNTWLAKVLEARKLTHMPCTAMRHMLLQESEDLAEIDSRRLAIPLGEVRWEREGVGGAIGTVTATKGKARDSNPKRKTLTTSQAALRKTALMTLVQMIESLETLLREASGKGQDEWDRWQGNMMNDLLKGNGTSWGECLEVGAWWARKKMPPG
jgi:SAM-dependent methyltransferase